MVFVLFMHTLRNRTFAESRSHRPSSADPCGRYYRCSFDPAPSVFFTYSRSYTCAMYLRTAGNRTLVSGHRSNIFCSISG